MNPLFNHSMRRTSALSPFASTVFMSKCSFKMHRACTLSHDFEIRPLDGAQIPILQISTLQLMEQVEILGQNKGWLTLFKITFCTFTSLYTSFVKF